jgi:hypothetical protein
MLATNGRRRAIEGLEVEDYCLLRICVSMETVPIRDAEDSIHPGGEHGGFK